MSGKTWSLSPGYAQRLLYEGWYLLLAVEAFEDDMPEDVLRQARDFRAMTEEYSGNVCPLPARESA